MPDENPLRDAIENLYKAFARYPMRKHVEGCPCCVHEPDKHALESKPLRQLTSFELGRYAFKAMTTWGNKDDFRHFLPRILELVVSGDGLGCDEEVVLGKLALAKWEEWPANEKSTLRVFFRVNWRWILSQSNPKIDPDSWLCGLGNAGEDLQVYLEDWTNARQADAYTHLAEFVLSNQPFYIKRHSLRNAFWPASPKAVTQLCNWMSNGETREALQKIYFEDDSATFAPALARAIDQMEQIVRA